MIATTRQTAALAVLIAVLLAPGLASAQLEGSYHESEVTTVGEDEGELQRESVRAQIRAEERAQARWFERQITLEEVERMDAAMNRLRDLVANSQPGSATRANYMFRLAELYYTKARYFEQRAYDRRDTAFELRDENPAQARYYEQSADDDLEQSDSYATQAVEQYVELYSDYQDTYEQMDAVLYYLGSTLSQLGRSEDALDFFEELANDYPASPYLPRALLAFGEYYFQLGDMRQAQVFYQAVSEFPDSPVYPYALYQEAWCFYNTEDYPEAVQRLLDAIDASSGEEAGRLRMRQRALEDLALFYVEVGSAADAFEFFEAVTPDETLHLVELVAGIFSEDSEYQQANTLYRELMSRNRDNFAVVRYQEEILYNTLPSQNKEEIVREMRRLVELYGQAREFPGSDPQEVEETGQRIEYQVRRWATTFHREAQVLNNEGMYALAYNLYGDYVTNLLDSAEPTTAYTMAYFYAELLYRNERYEDAAELFEVCLEMDPGGEYTEEAVYKAVLAYTKLVDMEVTAPEVELPSGVPGEGEDLPPIPAPAPLPEVMTRLLMAADRYIALDPPDEYAVEVKYVAAWVLYEYAHLEDAAQRFGDIALNYGSVDGERARVSAELLLDCLAALHDFEGMEEWIAQLSGSQVGTGPFGVRLTELGQQISFSRCRDVQLTGDHSAAGLCFFEFFRQYPDGELADRALYNAAYSFEEDDAIARAIRVREILLQYRSGSELATETRFTLGRAFHQLALYRDASDHYESYAREAPEAEHAMEALGNAAVFRQGLGEYDAAIADYETFIELFSDHPEETAEAFFQVGVIYQERGQVEEAIEQFRRYLTRYADQGRLGRAVEAATRLGELYWETNRDRAEEYFMDAIERFNALPNATRAELPASSLDAAAQARFMLGELIFERFSAVTIQGSEEQVQALVAQKREIGTQASAVYEQVRAFQRPGWSIAAFTRLGQLYHEFYNDIVNAPIPEGLPFEVEEQYRIMLENHATGVRTQAIEFYMTALDIARTAGWFNEYSATAETNLAELDPAFRAGNEIRAVPTYERSGFYTNGFIMSLEEEPEEAAPEETEGLEASTEAPEDRGPENGEAQALGGAQ